MKRAGFVRTKSYWVLPGDETSVVAHLQRSQYGRRCFFNVAIWINSAGKPKPPWQAHLGGRADMFVPDHAPHLRALLDDDVPMSVEQRSEELDAYVLNELLPALKPFDSLAGLKGRLPADFSGLGLTREAHEVLGMALPAEPSHDEPMITVSPWMGSAAAAEAELARLRSVDTEMT
jgi:hypothetical protein